MDQERRVVVGVNGSMASLAALRWAAREAGLRQARLHVVRALDPGRVRAAPYAGYARRLARGEPGRRGGRRAGPRRPGPRPPAPPPPPPPAPARPPPPGGGPPRRPARL